MFEEALKLEMLFFFLAYDLPIVETGSESAGGEEDETDSNGEAVGPPQGSVEPEIGDPAEESGNGEKTVSFSSPNDAALGFPSPEVERGGEEEHETPEAVEQKRRKIMTG